MILVINITSKIHPSLLYTVLSYIYVADPPIILLFFGGPFPATGPVRKKTVVMK